MNDQTEHPGATPGEDLSCPKQARLTSGNARNAAELEAISRAYDKYVFRARRKRFGAAWLTDVFIRRVRLDMFGDIWDWAGKYRTERLNMGMEPHLIYQQIKVLCGDFKY